LSAAAIAQVPRGTFGPYLGMRAEAVSRCGRAHKPALGLGSRARYQRAAKTNGQTVSWARRPRELGLVSVRPLRDGFALLSTHKTSDGEVVELSVLSQAARESRTHVARSHSGARCSVE